MGIVRERFNCLGKKGKPAFIPYITFGFPDIPTFESIIAAFDRAGADFIEIGLAFSDPIADGPIIQASSKQALDKGANIYKLFDSLKKLKNKVSAPFILMSYYNPIYSMGIDTFFKKAADAGISAVVVADLLVEESGDFIKAAKHNGIDTIFFISPTTQEKRVAAIARASSGFIYYITVTGVTGPRKALSASVFSHAARIRKKVKSFVCAGFGLSTQSQIRQAKQYFDGVIVGSVFIKKIFEVSGKSTSKNIAQEVEKLALWLNG